MEHKELMYEEACRIPFIISQPGSASKGKVDSEHLISNGLDLLPTLCDYAGIEVPKDLKGLSVRSLVEGESDINGRKALPIEGEYGRAIVTGRYKYVFYDKGENGEQLYDLEKDPGEMRNWAKNQSHSQVLKEHREIYRNVIEYSEK
jgi:arylsulfatase A-like enzyme